MTGTDANKAVVKAFLAAFSAGDIDGLLGLMTEGATWWVSGSVEGMSGTYEKRPLGELLKSVKPFYKTGVLPITPSGMIAEGDQVAVEAESYAELTNGRVYNSRYHFLFRIENGKVASVKEYMDTHHAYQIFFAP